MPADFAILSENAWHSQPKDQVAAGTHKAAAGDPATRLRSFRVLSRTSALGAQHVWTIRVDRHDHQPQLKGQFDHR
jgi:hypothetical protein